MGVRVVMRPRAGKGLDEQHVECCFALLLSHTFFGNCCPAFMLGSSMGSSRKKGWFLMYGTHVVGAGLVCTVVNVKPPFSRRGSGALSGRTHLRSRSETCVPDGHVCVCMWTWLCALHQSLGPN